MPNLFNRHWTRAELLKRVGHLSQVGGVQLLTSENGPSRGVRLLDFRTGTGFNFKVAIDRGMDVGYCEYRGASLAWIPHTLLPGPWYFEQQTEFGWLRTALGGFNNSSGMVHIGNPESDSVAHYNFPARPTERYGVHDRMALIPGELVSFGERWEDDDCIIEAVGKVTQAQAYGENLVMTRRYTAHIGEPRFVMRDEIENAGYLPTVHMLLYHINTGFPFVDEGSELIAPFGSPPQVLFGDADPHKPDEYSRFIAPQKEWVQQTFEHDMVADEEGRVSVALVNPKLGESGQGLYVRYSKRTMPRYIEWRMMGEGQYAVGIEPCTNTFGRDEVRRLGEQITLQPGERRVYETEVGILDGAGDIEQFRKSMRAVLSRQGPA
ncbi:MAG: aldose 1-epimerase family protein [Chloroflexota bacterium]|nr:aldose 1-epimerase family protein [Chloroflexota bacterium]